MSSFTLMYQNPVKRIQIKSLGDEETSMEIVFVDLEWSREVKHNVGTDLSEPYQLNGVNNRELKHVWISSHS